MAFEIEVRGGALCISRRVAGELQLAAERILRDNPEIFRPLRFNEPVDRQIAIVLDFDEGSGAVVACLRRRGESRGESRGTVVELPKGIVVVQDFCNDQLSPDYDHEYVTCSWLATSDEAMDVIRDSVAKRREFAENILARARKLEEQMSHLLREKSDDE
jgi:hypothetical protein